MLVDPDVPQINNSLDENTPLVPGDQTPVAIKISQITQCLFFVVGFSSFSLAGFAIAIHLEDVVETDVFKKILLSAAYGLLSAGGGSLFNYVHYIARIRPNHPDMTFTPTWGPVTIANS